MKKYILLFSIQLFLLSFGYSQCMSGDCKNGTGIFIYPSGAKYIGQFKNGEIHGIGACYYTNEANIKENGIIVIPKVKVPSPLKMVRNGPGSGNAVIQLTKKAIS
ncbi:MAG: hypothetical protein R2784_03230 [Saprospiraceae bacterium]